MSVTIKVKGSVALKKFTDNEVKIICENSEIRLCSWHKVRELIFQVYKVHEEGSDCEEIYPKCHIEIITDRGGDYVLEYSYELRNLALETYSMLLRELSYHMEDHTNQT